MASALNKGARRVLLPRAIITLSRFRTEEMVRNNKFVFRVPPTMSKFELKQLLTKVYDVDVAKVNTINYLGKQKRWQGRFVYKQKDWKKAYVRLNPRHEGDTFGFPFAE